MYRNLIIGTLNQIFIDIKDSSNLTPFYIEHGELRTKLKKKSFANRSIKKVKTF